MTKYTYILLAFFSSMMCSFSQTTDENGQRFITVTGSAEMSIAPDIIELEIWLKEYGSNKEKNKLQEIENAFFKTLNAHGIAKDQITFQHNNTYWYYWWSHRKEANRSQRYNVQLTTATNLLALMKDLDMKGIHSIKVSNATHSELQKFRKQVKIEAVKAAKEKAIYLLESIEEEVGGIISLEEVTQNTNPYWSRGLDNLTFASNSVLYADKKSGGMENISDIRLRYEIKAKFEIKS